VNDHEYVAEHDDRHSRNDEIGVAENFGHRDTPVFEAPARYLAGTSFSKLPSNCESALTTIRRRSADPKGMTLEIHSFTDDQEALIDTIIGWVSDKRL
jgi:hypothetical protein